MIVQYLSSPVILTHFGDSPHVGLWILDSGGGFKHSQPPVGSNNLPLTPAPETGFPAPSRENYYLKKKCKIFSMAIKTNN